jgi:hypothetical protein
LALPTLLASISIDDSHPGTSGYLPGLDWRNDPQRAFYKPLCRDTVGPGRRNYEETVAFACADMAGRTRVRVVVVGITPIRYLVNILADGRRAPISGKRGYEKLRP